MKRLKKETVHAIRDFIGFYAPTASKPQQVALLNEAVKNLECAANEMGGHECFFVHSQIGEGFDFETRIAYRMKLGTTRECICVDPFHDFEDVDA